MIVGFTVDKGNYEQEAIAFLQSKFSLEVDTTRHSLRHLLTNKDYIYYAPITSMEAVSQPFKVRVIGVDSPFYRNISDQKLEVPITSYLGKVSYATVNSGRFIFSSAVEEILPFVEKELLLRVEAYEDDSLSLLLETTGYLLLEDAQKIKLE